LPGAGKETSRTFSSLCERGSVQLSGVAPGAMRRNTIAATTATWSGGHLRFEVVESTRFRQSPAFDDRDVDFIKLGAHLNARSKPGCAQVGPALP
jgi:hypothetical protein